MTQQLKGKPVADQIRERVIADVEAWKSRGVTPKIATCIVEGDPASLYYAESKGRAAEKLGIEYELHKFPADISESFLLNIIEKLNGADDVHGIMLELPLPKHISTEKATSAIAPHKDVDGLNPLNLLATIKGAAGLYPATPIACIELLKHYGYTLRGKHVVLIGYGATVGLPLSSMLMREKATLTICNSVTPDLSAHLKQADIAFVATGRAGLVKPEMVHDKLVIIDAGINETADGNIVGDVEAEVLHHVAALSPTPGGVGTVTTAQLFANLMTAMSLQLSDEEVK